MATLRSLARDSAAGPYVAASPRPLSPRSERELRMAAGPRQPIAVTLPALHLQPARLLRAPRGPP